MATFEFVRKDGDLALFRWSGGSGESLVYGLLKGVADAQPGPLTLKALWEGQTASAILVAPSEPAGDLSGWSRYLGFPAQATFNLIAWLELSSTPPPLNPDPLFMCVAVNRTNKQLSTSSGFNLGALQVAFGGADGSNPANAVWDYDRATLTFGNAVFNAVRLDDNQQSTLQLIPATAAPTTMSLEGDRAGAIGFSLDDQDPNLLYNLAGILGDQPPGMNLRPMPEIRYFHPKGKLSFPLAAPLDVGTGVKLDVSFNPALPFSPSQTFFKPDLTQQPTQALFTCNSVRQTNGNAASLVPADGFGFHLGRTPNTFQGGPWRLFYPAPFGPLNVNTTTGGAIKLMCGLSGLEHLQLKQGDSVQLVPAQKAYAPSFVPPATGGGTGGGATLQPATDEALSDLGQSSWLSIRTPAGYFAQADVEPFFAAGVIPQTPYPSAVSSYLSDPNSVGSTAPAFPFAPHSAVYDASNSNSTPPVAPDAFTAYEAQVLVPHRYKALVPDGTVPVFGDHANAPLAGGGAATPTGFIAGLNAGPKAGEEAKGKRKSGAAALAEEGEPAAASSGTWSSLNLARHTEVVKGQLKDQTLAFLAPEGGTIYPPLIQGLLHSKVFLVANDWGVLGNMQSELVVDGFAFHVQPVEKADAFDTIAVFKFQTTASLESLNQTAAVWFRPDRFISTDGVQSLPDGIKRVQEAIRQAIAVADGTKGTPTDPFQYFRETIARDPAWTGVLFLHVPIDGGNMPPDLQILFAGIDGELYAHHFGVDLNHLAVADDGSPQLKQSSLFGVIHYQGKPSSVPTQPGGEDKKPFEFTLLDMTVAIENSVVTDFDALVAITIPEIFGRAVQFSDPDIPSLIEKFPKLKPVLESLVDTLIIQGVYQKQGDVGTVSFRRTDPLAIPTVKEGGFLRVVDGFEVTTSVLAPIASPAAPASQDQLIQGRFSMGGQLAFNPNPFGVADPADLFSFGNVDSDTGAITGGLDLENLGLNISFELDANGARVPGSLKITADYAHIIVSQSQSGVRAKSLLASFPVKITRLLQDDKGMTPSSLGASLMTVVNISGHDDGRPTFALVGDLPLGSMGFLAGAHADIASKLVLAWGPSDSTPDNDSAQVLVSLLNLSAEVKGFDLEGIVKVGFRDANLIRVEKPNGGDGEDVYVALFNNVALKVLGFTFPPNVLANFVLMAGTSNPAQQNIAWYLAAAQTNCGGTS